MTKNNARTEVKALLRLVRVQFAMRLWMRGAWIGGGLALVGQSLGRADNLGVLETTLGGMAGGAILFVLASLGRRGESFAWRLDRQLGLNEQTSAAWELQDVKSPMQRALVSDVLETLRGVRTRAWRKGWWLRGDVRALWVIGLLTLLVYLNRFTADVPVWNGAALPIPGVSSGPNDVPGSGQSSETAFLGSGGSGGTISPIARGELDSVLNQMGQILQEHTSTSTVGEALTEQNSAAAAAELEELALQADELTPEAKQVLEAAFDLGASSLSAPELEDLRSALETTADAASSGSTQALQDGLFNLAAELGSLGAATQAADRGGIEPGESAALTSILEWSGNQNGSFEIPSDEYGEGLVQTATANLPTTDFVLTGPTDGSGVVSTQTNSADYDSQFYSSEWSDIVLNYFTRTSAR